MGHHTFQRHASPPQAAADGVDWTLVWSLSIFFTKSRDARKHVKLWSVKAGFHAENRNRAHFLICFPVFRSFRTATGLYNFDHLWHLWPKCDQTCFAKKTIIKKKENKFCHKFEFVTVCDRHKCHKLVTHSLWLLQPCFCFCLDIRLGTALNLSLHLKYLRAVVYLWQTRRKSYAARVDIIVFPGVLFRAQGGRWGKDFRGL